MNTSLTRFHPIVRDWFCSQFDGPSPPQEAGWPHILDGEDTLIAAPTGSGKTLAAFMACLDSLVRQGLEGTLPDHTQVIYISPLKALSNDIQKNLTEPLAGMAKVAEAAGLVLPPIRVLVRTGDTPASERQAMVRHPPHILVTTPESLFILLTTSKSRKMLCGARTVIVDEVHALARDKRGAHLALTLERLEHLCGSRPQRIGLSATQRPVERVAQFLIGAGRQIGPISPMGLIASGPSTAPCAIIDLGHLRRIDLSVEIPSSPLQAVCSHETWEEVYERLAALVEAHRTTLIFVNTRALCERLAAHLSKRIGEEFVTSHHGSLSREKRLQAEQRLKAGSLRCLVATASLELGIDIGSIDLVCQIGPTHAIGTLMQRAGRAGHSLRGVSKAKVFALTIDDLMSLAALTSSIRRGDMDELHLPRQPMDILAQQIVAACAADDWDEDELFKTCRRACHYRDLTREQFDETVQMLVEGFAVRRGRTAALVHRDGVGQRLRGRRGARMAAITSGGAIPDTADYQVVLEPEGTLVGSLNEDFAIDSSPGDVFQLGNTAWRILKIETGKVRVADAHGQPPTIPFWIGEAPARTAELSQEVTRLRHGVEHILSGAPPRAPADVAPASLPADDGIAATQWLMAECNLEHPAAEQLCHYLAESLTVLTALPSQDTLILERFFDESGGMQLVLHAPLGRRITWAWGLALRKRFCRGFNFELQAAASENALLLSLGPQHSFPLEDVFHYLNSKSVEKLLVQATLEAAVFPTRWRWDATRSLALLRFSGGKKVPPQLIRMRADDLLAAVFPHAAACPENLHGDREVPDHPLVREVMHDCLHEAMDLEGLLDVLRRIEGGDIRLIARDTTCPSPLANEILTARPYAFLDDAPLEERRTRAVVTRRAGSMSDDHLADLDFAAIERVRHEAWPDPANADELHDSLQLLEYLTRDEMAPWQGLLQSLLQGGRVTCVEPGGLYVATERVPLFTAIHGQLVLDPPVLVPPRDLARQWSPEDALTEVVRGRMEVMGPATAERLASELSLPLDRIDGALLALEGQGVVLRGRFCPGATLEWCDRRLLARIHRYTINRLRSQVQPASAADFMRFLMVWQHVHPGHQLEGTEGVREAVAQLQGCEIAAVAWERDVLAARVRDYDPAWLDRLSLGGELTWGRISCPAPGQPGKRNGMVRHTPISLLLGNDGQPAWPHCAEPGDLSVAASEVVEQLRERGAMFFQQLVRGTGRQSGEVETALGELVAAGLVTCDGYAGLRALLLPAATRAELQRRRRYGFRRLHHATATPAPEPGFEGAGRWSLLASNAGAVDVEAVAMQLLRRWGVVFHRVLLREASLPPWRDILRVYRTLELRGEIRGGRFIAGFSGEQYALPEAVERLRAIRNHKPDEATITICGCDPLNLAGIITPGDRVPARSANRIVYRDGVPVNPGSTPMAASTDQTRRVSAVSL